MHNLQKIALALMAVVAGTNAQAIDLITNSDTTLSLGGIIKVEGVFASPDDEGSEFEGNIQESRINLTTTKVIDEKKLKGFIEGDFYGDYASGGSNLRLRHAFLQLDNVTVGKTWNGQFFSVVPLLTEQLDFGGLAFGTVAGNGLNIRPDFTVHYANKGLRVTAQEPVYATADLPDLVVSYSGKVSDFGYNKPDVDYTVTYAVKSVDIDLGDFSYAA